MILTSGAFDGMHAGHVAYLEAAKALCLRDEILLCAVAPDSYIVQAKGRQPYWHQADRLRTVAALQCVDATIPQKQPSVAPIIYDYRPRLFLKGPDWDGCLPEEVQRACEQVGTAIGYLDTPGTNVSHARLSDEEAVSRFEQLVLSQRPAETPWQPVTDYSFEARKKIEGKHPQLIIDCLTSGVDEYILDYGCGPDGHLVRLINDEASRRGDCQVSAIGYDPQADESILNGSLTRTEPPLETIYNLVICREVLEHLPVQRIAATVRKLCRYAVSLVYITTRFAQSPTHLLSVDTSDDLDPTHMTMLNQNFLRTLFVLEGFKRRKDLESKMDWLVKGRALVYQRA